MVVADGSSPASEEPSRSDGFHSMVARYGLDGRFPYTADDTYIGVV